MDAIRHILLIAALVPGLAVSSVLAPEHAHESDAVGHVSVVHRHIAPHAHHPADVFDPGHDAAEVSDADEHVVWTDQVGIVESIHLVPESLVVVVPLGLDLAPRLIKHAAVAADTATLAHGPPRVSLSLRGPPLASRLI